MFLINVKNNRSNFITLIPLILSGGAGTTLLPLSWGDHPKQFLKLTSDKTMIHETLLRLEGLETRNPIISCGEGHRFMVAQQLGEVLSKSQQSFWNNRIFWF